MGQAAFPLLTSLSTTARPDRPPRHDGGGASTVVGGLCNSVLEVKIFRSRMAVPQFSPQKESHYCSRIYTPQCLPAGLMGRLDRIESRVRTGGFRFEPPKTLPLCLV